MLATHGSPAIIPAKSRKNFPTILCLRIPIHRVFKGKLSSKDIRNKERKGSSEAQGLPGTNGRGSSLLDLCNFIDLKFLLQVFLVLIYHLIYYPRDPGLTT